MLLNRLPRAAGEPSCFLGAYAVAQQLSTGRPRLEVSPQDGRCGFPGAHGLVDVGQRVRLWPVAVLLNDFPQTFGDRPTAADVTLDGIEPKKRLYEGDLLLHQTLRHPHRNRQSSPRKTKPGGELGDQILSCWKLGGHGWRVAQVA